MLRAWRKFPTWHVGGYPCTRVGPVQYARPWMLTYVQDWEWMAKLPHNAAAVVFCRLHMRNAVRLRGSHPVGTVKPAMSFWEQCKSLAEEHGHHPWPTRPFKTTPLGPSPALGAVMIWPGTYVSSAAAIDPGIYGENTEIHTGAYVDNNVHIGHSAIIGVGAVLVAGTTIGGWAKIGAGAKIVGATVRDGVHIGAGALVGWGSNVVRDVDPGAVVYGNPAKVRR